MLPILTLAACASLLPPAITHELVQTPKGRDWIMTAYKRQMDALVDDGERLAFYVAKLKERDKKWSVIQGRILTIAKLPPSEEQVRQARALQPEIDAYMAESKVFDRAWDEFVKGKRKSDSASPK